MHKFHRVERDPATGLVLPALTRVMGSDFWCTVDRPHRSEFDPWTGLSLPAMVGGHGDMYWWNDGERQRIDGPAYPPNAYYWDGNIVTRKWIIVHASAVPWVLWAGRRKLPEMALGKVVEFAMPQMTGDAEPVVYVSKMKKFMDTLLVGP